MRRSLLRIVFVTVFFILLSVAWKLFEARLVNWANEKIDKTTGQAIPSFDHVLQKIIIWPKENPRDAYIGLAVLYVVSLASAVFVPIVRERHKARQVRLDACFTEEKRFVKADGELVGGRHVAVARIFNGGPDVTVTPELEFTDAMGKSLTVQGRWEDSALPEHPDSFVPAIAIKTGEKRTLDIAVRFWGDDCLLFALDNKSPFQNYRVPDYSLAGDTIKVRLTLRGTIDKTWTLELLSRDRPIIRLA